MTMSPGLRRFALTGHVTSSVGWLGAVAVFLALAVAGLRSSDPDRIRAAYLAMESTGWFVIVPLAFLSLPTGLILSFGTEWGLFRHYWIVVKFLITVLATFLLLVHMQPVGHLALAVERAALAHGEMGALRLQLVANAGAAIAALLAATALSIYKPRGLTPYGRRVRGEGTGEGTARDGARPRWVGVLGVVALALAALFVVLHLAGRGLHGH